MMNHAGLASHSVITAMSPRPSSSLILSLGETSVEVKLGETTRALLVASLPEGALFASANASAIQNRTRIISTVMAPSFTSLRLYLPSSLLEFLPRKSSPSSTNHCSSTLPRKASSASLVAKVSESSLAVRCGCRQSEETPMLSSTWKESGKERC